MYLVFRDKSTYKNGNNITQVLCKYCSNNVTTTNVFLREIGVKKFVAINFPPEDWGDCA